MSLFPRKSNHVSIPHILGKERYETQKGTTVFVDSEDLTTEAFDAVLGKELVTFSARNENSGRGHGRNIFRSIMRVTGHQMLRGGLNVFLELDLQSLPITQKQLDGR